MFGIYTELSWGFGYISGWGIVFGVFPEPKVEVLDPRCLTVRVSKATLSRAFEADMIVRV